MFTSEILTNKGLLTSKATESRWLAIANLPKTATEETVRDCFKRHGRVQSVKIEDNQCFAFISFLDVRTASKAHHAENILDEQQLRTAFHDGSNLVPKALLETALSTCSIIEPVSSSPSSITTVTDTLMDKTINGNRDKHSSCIHYSPDENTRHQVVPVKHDSDSLENKRKILSSEFERSKDNRLKQESFNSKTRILKISHLPAKMSSQSLRETLWNIFANFKKSSHLLTIEITNDYALLKFTRSEDVNKALLFAITKSIDGVRLKAEPYDDFRNENNEYDSVKRSICSDSNMNEYSEKATRTLYIGNLQSEVSYNHLREIYSVYGDIIELEIKRQQQQQQIFAFIQYADIKSVVKVMKAFQSKHIPDHSIKLGFGKSQPTNVLWLDDLPGDITESILRPFLIHITNIPCDEILDIYIDNRDCHKSQISQCLIYFTDVIVAEKAINSIRGKKFESKRIQVDFASRAFITRFSDIIEETTQKNIHNNDRWTNTHNRSDEYDRRYSKVSDTGSSSSHPSVHSEYEKGHPKKTSTNHSQIIKAEKDNDTTISLKTTEHVFDWLTQNSHSNENRVEILKNPIKNENTLSTPINHQQSIPTQSKKIFQTKVIPLEPDLSYHQTDIRLKFYSTLFQEHVNQIHLPFPKFALEYIFKTSKKSSNASVVLNPKAHLKHSSLGLNYMSNNTNLSTVSVPIDERVKLFDKQNRENSSTRLFDKQTTKNFNELISALTSSSSTLTPCVNNADLNAQQIASSTSLLNVSSLRFHTAMTTENCNRRLSDTLLTFNTSSTVNYRLPSSTNFLSSSISNGISTTNLSSSSLSDLSTLSSGKLLERLDSLEKLKHKSIPSPLSVITTLPTPSNTNHSSICLTPESSTPNTILENPNYSPASISSSQQQPLPNNSTSLRSILKQHSNVSATNERKSSADYISPLAFDQHRKSVQIISLESIMKQTSSSDDNKKTVNQKNDNTLTQSKTLVNNNKQQSLAKLSTKTNTVKPSNITKGTSVVSRDIKASQSTMKRTGSKLLKTTHQVNGKSKNSVNKLQTDTNPVQQKKTSLLNNQITKRKSTMITIQKNPTNKTLLTTIKPSLAMAKIDTKKSSDEQALCDNEDKIEKKIIKKSTNGTLKDKFKLRQNTCMYDRIKKQPRTEQKIEESSSPTSNDHSLDQSSDNDTRPNNVIRLKQCNVINDLSNSENDKQSVVFDSNIFNTEENDNNNKKKINQQEIKNSNSIKQKMSTPKITPVSQKRSSTDEINKSSKKIKLNPKISSSIKLKIVSSEKCSSDTNIENITSDKLDISLPSHQSIPSTETSKNDDHQSIPVDNIKPTSDIVETPKLNDSTDEQIKSSQSLLTTETQPISIEKESTDKHSHKEITEISQQPILKSPSATLNVVNDPLILNTNSSSDHQSIITTNETLKQSDIPLITSHKHPLTPVHLFPKIPTPDSTLFTPHHQHFSYPLFSLPPPTESPPLSARKLSATSSNSMINKPFFNTIMPGQQHNYDTELRRDSSTKFSMASSPNRSTSNQIFGQQQYLGPDSIVPFQNIPEVYGYGTVSQQMLNSFATELYHYNDYQSYEPYNIQWKGYVRIKTDHAYIKTQLIAGNPQIARISMNYWNLDLNHNLLISQRMRLEQTQLDAVKKRLQLNNDYCILIGEPSGLTPNEIRLEQNNLKNGVIKYLNEKQAAGIININLPGVLQPVYIAHIFPPCQFASDILQKYAPDTNRCVVQNKTEQIYLLIIITSTVQ